MDSALVGQGCELVAYQEMFHTSKPFIQVVTRVDDPAWLADLDYFQPDRMPKFPSGKQAGQYKQEFLHALLEKARSMKPEVAT